MDDQQARYQNKWQFYWGEKPKLWKDTGFDKELSETLHPRSKRLLPSNVFLLSIDYPSSRPIPNHLTQVE